MPVFEFLKKIQKFILFFFKYSSIMMTTFLLGLFANRSFEKGTFISFYNGIRMLADDLDEDSKEVNE